VATAVPIKTPKHRVNFLILASDNDSKMIPSNTKLSATSGVFPNTQVMIFISYDPVHQQVYMISIPRDLWVPIPGYGYNKVSLAAGSANIQGAINTVQANFGVSIDHYAWVGLFGFIKIINSVGGVDINVIHPMVENDFPDDIDNPQNPYAYRRFFIAPGPVHLDGETAELYVRARHSDLLSDFGRSQRQQQVLLALRKKVQQRVDAGDLDLASVLAQDLKGEALTDMTIPDLLGLAHSLLTLPSSHIHKWIMNNYTVDNPNERLPDGTTTDALDGNWDSIHALFACVDSDQAVTGCPGL
jgi:LCP family protein required for cell wall assembly